MKASTGFILRNLAGEYVVMPAGDNIGAFGGAILMNELSAFVWEQSILMHLFGIYNIFIHTPCRAQPVLFLPWWLPRP